jgi:23S rRNA (cytosine1962-C5)-methyltransferase
MSYLLVDSGNQKKLEQFGEYLLVRPCAQAVWKPKLTDWRNAHAEFSRDGGNSWRARVKLPEVWQMKLEGLVFKISPTDFGHLGVFPEHSLLWEWMGEKIKSRQQPNILNLFAYSGGATLACARAGAKVCHLDASKGMVSWARENAALNRLESAPIRWIVDDVMKFLQREVKRGVKYDGIILDPPSFGRGNRGEIFKFEEHLHELLSLCKAVLSDNPLFVVLTSHTAGISPLVMRHLVEQMMGHGNVESGEMVIEGERDLPCGSYGRWTP